MGLLMLVLGGSAIAAGLALIYPPFGVLAVGVTLSGLGTAVIRGAKP